MTILPIPPDRAEWLALRARRIGASEVAALWDVQAPYALSRWALWHVKAGLAPPPEVAGTRPAWGIRLEQVIAEAAAEQEGWSIRKGRYAVCDDCDHLGATLDFEAHDGTEFGPGVLETKNADWMIHKRQWVDGEPPIHILLQLQAQLACTGYAWGAVAALVGGNDLHVYSYAAKPKLIADMKARAIAFYRSIDGGRPPPVDGSDGATDVLRSLYPEVIDDSVDMRESNEWPEACADFIKAQAAKKEATGAYDLAKNRVELLLAGSKRGWGGGFSASVAVTPAKAERAPKPGEMISGRAESRRLTVKEQEA